MVPKPVSYDSYSSEDFEADEAPETVSFSASRGHAKKLRNARDAAAADAKRKLRERRREMMRKTREDAMKRKKLETILEPVDEENENEENNGEGDEADLEEEIDRARELQARMDRAMTDAEAEEDNGEGEEAGQKGWSVFTGTSKPTTAEPLLDDPSMSSDGERMDDDRDADPDEDEANPDYLPDHLFAEALSKAETSRKTKKETATAPSEDPNAKRKLHKKQKSEDIVIGSKTIRTVKRKHPLALAASRNKQPGNVKRFVESNLGFKGNAKSRRTRSRQPANIGSMRSRTQAAQGFVRGN